MHRNNDYKWKQTKVLSQIMAVNFGGIKFEKDNYVFIWNTGKYVSLENNP